MKVHCAYALSMTIGRYYQDVSQEIIDGYIKKLGITIQSARPVLFTPEELKAFNTYWNENKDHIFEDVIVRQSYAGELS